MKHETETVSTLFAELMESPLQRFPRFGQELIAPDLQGVYVIYGPRGKVLHVGRTSRAKNGIAQRFRNHMGASSSFTKKYLKGDGSKLRGKYRFRCLVVKNPRRRALLEAYAAGHMCPAHLGIGAAVSQV